MQLRQLTIKNFRGVKSGQVSLSGHSLLVGGNGVGKSTVCEAIDLLIGPDRLNRATAISEHDFYERHYLDEDGGTVEIVIEGVLTDLDDATQRIFRSNLEYWDLNAEALLDQSAGPAQLRAEGIVAALRIRFTGRYDPEEDEFVAETAFMSPPAEEDSMQPRLGTRDKRRIGFLYLRALRTGSRALSLERGSLLDIVLRVKEADRTKMWEHTLKALEDLSPPIHEIEELKEILDGLHKRIGRFVERSSANPPLGLFASRLTREHLRQTVTLFAASSRSEHLVPYWQLGSGVVGAMVFSLLTFIAELKKNVIFAMEEPEISIPPHTQRRIVQFLLQSMDQVIVTSHSPYVLEEFPPDAVVVLHRDKQGALRSERVQLGEIKSKTYRGGLRRVFAEAILGRGVICVEGISDDAVLTSASSVLERESPEAYTPLDLAGVTVVSTQGEGELDKLGIFFSRIGLRTYTLFDATKNEARTSAVESAFFRSWRLEYTGIEKLLAAEVPVPVQHRFLATASLWPDYPRGQAYVYAQDLADEEVKKRTLNVLKVRKGERYAAQLVEMCKSAELPQVLTEVLHQVASDIPVEPLTVQGKDETDEPDDGD